MKSNLIRLFRGLSLRQRFLVAPLLGLVVYSLLTAAFIYESQRQNALLHRLAELDLSAFNHYAEVFVNLTEQHTALYVLLDRAESLDEAALYDKAKHHIYKVQQAIDELEQVLLPIDNNAIPGFAALRDELLVNARAYRNGVINSIGMATVNVAVAHGQLDRENERFTAMNHTFVRLLNLKHTGISSEIDASVRQSQISGISIAVISVSFAILLLFLSLILSRILSRSLEKQIDILTDLGTQTSAHVVIEGRDEVERMTHAVAAFRQSLLELHESERRFSDLLQNVELVSLMLDRDARITYCNEYLLRLTGWRHEEVIGQNWFELFVPPEIKAAKDNFAGVLANRSEEFHHENEILTRSGERRLIRWNHSVLRSGAGDVIGMASIGEDITQRKEAEARIAYLNRVYAILSGINTLIVRARDRDELFREACRIAVEVGGFRMAWIGIVDRSAMKIVLRASTGGDERTLAAIQDRLSLNENMPLGNTIAAQAILGKKTVVSNNSQHDPKIALGTQYAERGIRSIAMLPLMVADEAAGILGLYAGEIEFFHEEELTLLTELAGDIAFAMDHIEKQKQLEYLSFYDVLTGLANRSLFLERVSQYMRSTVSGGHKLVVALIDLERFKNLNDSLGRSVGDALLKQVAEWLTHNMGDASLFARFDADHFAAVLPDITEDGDVTRFVEKSMNMFLDHPFHLNNTVFRISAKAGVALFPDDGTDAETLVRNAEAALKKAKASGERYLFYAQAMNERVAEKLSLENQLRQALDNEEFVLHYQPKVNIASGVLTSAEALIRWNDPRTGLVPPGQFIPVLEETGLISEVGRWALRKAIDDYLRWRATGLAAVRVAVNVSPLQLRSRGFVADVREAIGVDTRAAAGLELEITESLIMEDVKHSTASLQAIRGMGVTIAIDDFGTGFSSLSYLSKLPVDKLKIDRSFIIDMTTGPEGLALVSTIINLAHSLKLKVVAEGVETEEQLRLLRLLNCDEMQGYLFSRPMPREVFETLYLSPPDKKLAL